jgi:hypothetical protein
MKKRAKKNFKKRIPAFFLSFMMLLSLLPMSELTAFAESTGQELPSGSGTDDKEQTKDSYVIQDASGKELTEADGENGWYRSNLTVLPKDSGNYTISKTDAEDSFGESVKFSEADAAEEGSCVIYLKDNSTGDITGPVEVPEAAKIDTTAPDKDRISIRYSEPVTKRIFWFYSSEVTVTLTAYDAASGIDHFNWTYTGNKDATEDVLRSSEGEVKARAVEGEEGMYTASFTLPEEDAAQLKGSLSFTATDQAGLTSEVKDDKDTILVVDTIAPELSVSYEAENADTVCLEKDDHYYYNGNVRFTFSITEANFYAEDVKISVLKEGKEEIQDLSWNKTSAKDLQEATLLLEEEGDYVIRMIYQDPSGNEMKNYESSYITIDKTTPLISFSYSKGNNTDTVSDTAQKAVITVKEKNFDASAFDLTAEAEDINGDPVTADTEKLQDYLQDPDNWTKEGDSYRADLSEELSDAIYRMSFTCTDLAGNEADPTDSGSFTVDHTAPSTKEMEISYSTPVLEKVISAITFGYYNPDVTVTFTAYDKISGIDHFTWSYTRQERASETSLESYANTELKAVQDKEDKSRYSVSVTLPKEKAEQLRGSISLTASDGCANSSDKLTDSGHVIIVDTIAPTMTAEYTEGCLRARDKIYYNQNLTASFTVTEANFYAEDVKVELSKDGTAFKEVSLQWTEGSFDLHKGTYTIPASSDHKGDGSYVFKVSYKDRSGNRMETYTSDPIVIDTKKPKITVSYDNTEAENTLTDTEGNSRSYFNQTQTATVTIREENFASDEVELSITAKDASGKALNRAGLYRLSGWKDKKDSHTIVITYPGDANYSFDIDYTDLAGNKADDYEEDHFTVDKRGPADLSISYSTSLLDNILSGITFGFYNAPVTVRISAKNNISGIHGFTYSYLKASGVSSINAELVEQYVPESALQISGNGTGATAVFTIPRDVLGYGNQFNGYVSFSAEDRSGNSSGEYTDSKRIVVDNIAPTASVSYNAPVNTESSISYYDGDIEATIRIDEANFYVEDVEVSVSKDGASYPASPVWTDESTDIHVGSFRLTEDGEYLITINYKDKSSNKMLTYISERMTIDTKLEDPLITINGEDGNGKSYKDEVVPSVSFEDTNLEGCEIKLTRTRYDKKDEDVTEEFIGNRLSMDETGGSGSFDTFEKKVENDGIYTLTASVTDKAGHKAAATCIFTVNRYGSVYVYSDYLISLIKEGGAYVQSLEEDLLITEYNADRLISGSLDVEASRDGRPMETVELDVTPKISDSVPVGESGWYQYAYRIAKENFTEDGVYSLALSSKDSAGNSPETGEDKESEILFHVDSTSPEISSISGLEESIINAEHVNVSYSVYDTMALDSVKVYVNDELKEEITNFSEDLNNYEGSFTLSESSDLQHVRIVVSDKAGNVTDTTDEAFQKNCAYSFCDSVTISTSFFVRSLAWIKGHTVLLLSAGAGLIILILLILILLKRRRDKRNQTRNS